MGDILSFFPVVPGKFEKPYKSQENVIKTVDEAFKDFKYVILESPVGSGKSAIAMTLARAYGGAHILIPRKSLQDQYFSDFEEYITLMKGRSSYSCGFDMGWDDFVKVKDAIRNGQPIPPLPGERTCAEGPCKDSETKFNKCMDRIGVCPYSLAIQVAQDHPLVIHNFWSFIYQSHFAGRFSPRELLVVDECHMMEDILRDFTRKRLNLPGNIPESVTSGFTSVNEWIDWLIESKELHPKDKEEKEKFLTWVESLSALPEDRTIVEREYREDMDLTRYEFTPKTLGNLPREYIFNYGEKVLLMSGTVYDKARFCKTLGIGLDEACFIRAPSSFPTKIRPVYVKDEYSLDLSHKNWHNNQEEMGEKIRKILDVFHDVKGLIHAPSYQSIMDIMRAVKSDRLISHDRLNFQNVLEQFYDSKGNEVLISPICQQGVDFKGDRARFQIILRVPYPNVGDLFTNIKMQEDFPWYNYQTLLTFGQQLGRVNRGPDDFGVTVLMDSRFKSFILKNRKYLPKWQQEAFIFR